MKPQNLIVLCNKTHAGAIERSFPDHIIVSDVDIYKILNGADFNGEYYEMDSIDELCKDIVKQSADEPMVVHSFNPLVLNQLEALKLDDNFDKVTDFDACAERFMICKNGKFSSLLNIEQIRSKMKTLAIGDAIADVHLEMLVDEAEL